MVMMLTTQQGTLSTATLKEIFVYTLVVNNTAAASSATVASTVATAWKAAWTSNATFKNHFATPVIWTECTAAKILDPVEGDLEAAAHIAYSPTLAGIGSSSTPSQNAIGISFAGGAKANGTPWRGRHYLPTVCSASLDTNGLMSSTVTDTVRNTYLSYFTNLVGSNMIPMIWSRKYGQFATISQVRVGNKVDTIRRRRNELPETYSTGVLTRSDGRRVGGDPDEDLDGAVWRVDGPTAAPEGDTP